MPFLTIKTTRTLLTTALLAISFWGSAQTSSITPYSRFGFGELEDRAFGMQYALGGAGVGLADSNSLNMMNPASYSFIPRHRPIFNVGLRGKFYEFESASSTDVGRTVYLKNINFGIPIKKNWGLSFGLMPFSTVGYTATSEQNIPDVGDVTYKYSGEGGTNLVYSGLSWMAINKPEHKLSVGANAGFLFGNTTRSRDVIFEGVPFVNSKIEETVVVQDFLFDAGLLYRGTISKNWRYSVGASFHFPTELSSRRDQLEATWYQSGGIEQMLDTASYSEDVAGSVVLPKKISYGVVFDNRPDNGSRWLIAADYSSRNWSEYSQQFDSVSVGDDMSSSNMIAIGLEYQPMFRDVGQADPKVWEKVTYRMGLRYVNTQIQIGDDQLEEYGIRFGVGIPVTTRGSISSVNIGFDLSRRGTTENNLIQENRLGVHLGFTLSPMAYERWFIKRKYD